MVTASLRGVIEGDRFPHAPRLDPLKAALGKLVAEAEPTAQPLKSNRLLDLKPKAPPPAKADKRTRGPAGEV